MGVINISRLEFRNRRLVIFLLAYLILMPYPGFLGNLCLRAIDLSIFLSALVVYFILNVNHSIEKTKNNSKLILLILFIITLWQSIVLCINSVFWGRLVFADLFDLYKVPLYFLLFYLGIQLRQFDKEKIVVFFSFILIIEFILSIIQITIGGFSQALFTGRDFNSVYLNYSGRAIGTLGNPNYLGIFAVSLANWYLYLVITKKKNIIKYLILMFLAILIVFMTQSRTSFILTACLFFIQFFFISLRKKRKIILNVLIFLAFLFVSYFIYSIIISGKSLTIFGYELSYLFTGMNKVISDGINEQSSFKQRTELWHIMLGYIKQNPWIGYGPSKGYPQIPDVADNNYIYFIFKYGIINLFLWLILWITILKDVILNIVHKKHSLSILVLLFWIVLFTSSLTMESLESLRVASVVYFLTGLNFGSNKN
ncbi:MULTISPECIES: O-antigen ligase family protein [Heyndrickxia]|uniref:O-antigen ligase family protein n=1 Tax=Heyndrickxia TaxID=2837504 RepID=UPI002DB7C5B6|nr:O-antigen ligase family protein [Weizmannia sp. CD-2023]MEC2222768.1 O-antigen ligase family protein [Weizmannia sp. CD-2023]